MTKPILTKARARAIFLDRHGLSAPTTGPGRGSDLAAVIGGLGFVQLDSVNTFARAHDLILWTRRRRYQPAALGELFTKDRVLFEHWTHDSSVLPIGLFPHWQHRFDRNRLRLADRWANWHKHDFLSEVTSIKDRIAAQGPCTSSDVGPTEGRKSGGWWDWHPSKTALEYLWQVGELSVVRRDGFSKVYDLTDRVIPTEFRAATPTLADSIDWAMNAAVDHLGFANATELRGFHQLFNPAEVKAWVDAALAKGTIIEATITGDDGDSRAAYLRPDTLDLDPAPALAKLRIMSPFDPALRDRKRAEWLFDFHYRIEMFVPAPKRIFGYYVFPVLDGDQIIGRIDMKTDRAAGVLRVAAFWPQAGVAFGKARLARLDRELDACAAFAGCAQVDKATDWWRDPKG